MDPWFENFKILLTYWLMSTNRDNVNINMADTTVSTPPSQHYTDHLQPHLPMPPPPHQGHGHMGPMGPSQTSLSRGVGPYSMPPAPLNTPMPQPTQSTNCPVNRDLPHPGSIPETTTSQSQAVSSTCDSQTHGLNSPPNGIHSPQQHNLPESTTNPPVDRNHLCPTCSKGFKSKQQLAQHSLVHSGIRKYICSYCDKAFKQLCHLQQHTRIHTGEKPYKCSFEGCDRAFAQMANLHHHMRNHDDHLKKAATKQYHCMICHRAYTNESSLKSHTLKMHVHIKPLEQRITGLPTKPRKPRQPKMKDSTSPVMAIDLTCDDGSDSKVDIFSRVQNDSKVDIFSRVQALQRNDDYSRINSFQRADFQRSDSLHRDDFRRADNLQRADSFPRNEALQRADNFQRADSLSRDLQRGDSLQRESLHRSDSLQRLAGLDSSLQLRTDSRQQQHTLGMSVNSPISRVIPNVPRCMTLSDRLTDTPTNKNLTASELLHPETSSTRSDLQQSLPAHSNVDPVSYYRPSPYNLPPHISHAHLPMRIPTSLPPFTQMGSGLESVVASSNASVFSNIQEMMSSQHSLSTANHMTVNSPTASSPQRLTN
ncbi:zinc finger protein 134-like [Pecten maximus]|uniref:zinc finger protein 134-like n=1 Tax=Pecten maximus TaxID=6579 RepID=UPI001458021E|nr:zinc finger protein 134-like [Pecten maximus]